MYFVPARTWAMSRVQTSWNNIFDLNSYKNLPITPGSTVYVWSVGGFFNSWFQHQGWRNIPKNVTHPVGWKKSWLTSAYPINLQGFVYIPGGWLLGFLNHQQSCWWIPKIDLWNGPHDHLGLHPKDGWSFSSCKKLGKWFKESSPNLTPKGQRCLCLMYMYNNNDNK